jgi:hypothetical protein
VTQLHFNFLGSETCGVCGRSEDDLQCRVTWRCCVCNKLVCRHCTLLMPDDHPEKTSSAPEYYYDTYCSERCRCVQQGEKQLSGGKAADEVEDN